MTDQRIFRVATIAVLLNLLLNGGCKPTSVPPHPSDTTPKMRATIVTIRTVLQPANENTTHTIVIAEGRARSSEDLDRWRLFDFTRKEVTFVDDIRKTKRTETFAAIFARVHQEIARPLPDGSPRATFGASGARRAVAGVTATEWVLRIGRYERHLWIGQHPLIPDELFAILDASATRSSPLAGLNRPLEEAIQKTAGFPMIDHAELPYRNAKLIVDRSVIGVAQRDVPQSWLSIPAADRAMPPPAPADPPATASRHL